MKVFEIKESPPFLTREKFEDIKKRLNVMPNIQYEYNGQDLMSSEKSHRYATIYYINARDFFRYVVQDMNDLVSHVENADKENDRLKFENMNLQEKINQMQENINLLTAKLNGVKYENGNWILDV